MHRNKYKEAAKLGRQINRPQMREQNSPEEELDEMEISNLLDREFRVKTIRISNSMEKDTETIKKDLSEIKKLQYLK